MFCIKCGEKNDGNANFCANCGLPLADQSRPGRLSKGVGRSLLVLLLAIFFIAAGTALLFQDEVRRTAAIWLGTDTAEPAGTVPEPVSVAVPEEREEAEEPVLPANEEKKTETNHKAKTAIIKEAQQKVYTILTETGMGSGFLFTDTGMVVTNAHVVAGVTDVMVRTVNGQEKSGRVVGISDESDIALILVDAFAGMEPLETELAATPVGTEVIALGSPSGFENTASIGYLTGTERDFEVGFIYEDVYQIDAQVAPGSSGGPLIDAKTGKVIGINSLLIMEGPEIGFSIPMYSMHSTLTGWADNPMSEDAVVSVFGSSEGYGNYEDGAYEYNYDETTAYEYDETSLGAFIGSYRDFYEMALQYEDFIYVADLLVYDSDIYHGIREYIDSIAGQGMEFEFTSLEVTDVEIFKDHALVHTHETFDFKNSAGEWSAEERVKTYTVVMDEYGYYYISAITRDK
ncbi:trypsin-like peptidase domain-containing protein [Planococcus lenghuensis]|uniref:Protease Do n=1 Tax=Planococcus lenghuensis TaxID=2213202 RepID=A0A1Q2L0T4_9BACL|nr:trypsin-like peptidase domain-containing protein [Planococcus lenghuensis]AQQ54049.1 protease Do [Planococcus lenghuensis]